MDMLKNALGSATNENQNQNQAQQQQQQPVDGRAPEQGGANQGGLGGIISGLTNKVNSAAGGGVESEKNEDYLDKGIDAFQQYGLKQGDQSNESAVEQAKDEQISDFIRGQYKSATGKEFPVQDKETRLG